MHFETIRPAVLKIRSVGTLVAGTGKYLKAKATLVAGTGKYLKAKAAKSGYWLMDER